MNEQHHDFAPGISDAPGAAFAFTGTWREFAPIAFSNFALTLVTLGIYRFWAKTRERRYLWSRTRFIDDQLEWTGTGGEMFRGFLIAVALLLPPLLFLQFGVEALVLRKQFLAAAIGTMLVFLLFVLLTGAARFLALRYRLSRTLWHGIRGGGGPGAVAYAISWLWKSTLGFIAAGLLIPWSMTALWNERWSRMSFGPLRFHAAAGIEGLMGRWILVLLSPLIAVMLLGVLGIMGAASGLVDLRPEAGGGAGAVLGAVLLAVAVYALIGLIGIGYFAAYLRTAIGALELGDLRFEFTASSMDWLKLFAGHVGLVIVTLGLGALFISYRNWSFFIRHLGASGDVQLDDLTQSDEARRGDAEGLAAAFDLGAI
jgi:uncharacterized membrane protein YjgN (DUF898 family)